MEGEDLKIALSNELLIFTLFFLLDEAFLGIPLVQVISQHNVLPPNRLENVAASLCPGNSHLQLLLLCVAAMDPPCDQKYVRVPSALIISKFTLRCDRPVLRPPVFQLLSLSRTGRGRQVESVYNWFCREVMVDRRLFTCLVVARLAWARVSMFVWLARLTLRNYLINWACLVKWA